MPTQAKTRINYLLNLHPPFCESQFSSSVCRECGCLWVVVGPFQVLCLACAVRVVSVFCLEPLQIQLSNLHHCRLDDLEFVISFRVPQRMFFICRSAVKNFATALPISRLVSTMVHTKATSTVAVTGSLPPPHPTPQPLRMRNTNLPTGICVHQPSQALAKASLLWGL